MYRRLYYILLLLCFSGVSLKGQNNMPVGNWKAWTSMNSPKMSTWRQGTFFTITKGGLFSFSESTGEIRTFTTVDGLSGLNTSSIFYDELHDKVIIGYEDGTLNYFTTPDAISVVSDIRRSQLFGNKRINDIVSFGNFIFIATGFGVVQYDMVRQETRNTFSKIGDNESGAEVSSMAIYEGRLYVSTPKGLYSASLAFPNLADSNAWRYEQIMSLPQASGVSKFVCGGAEGIFCNYRDTVYGFTSSSGWENTPLEYGTWSSLTFHHGILSGTFEYRVNALFPDGYLAKFNLDQPIHVYPNPEKSRRLMICQRDRGWWSWDDVFWVFPIAVDGPTNNFATEIAVGKNEFYIAPRGYGLQFDNSGIYYYHKLNGWKVLNGDNGGLIKGRNDIDFVSTVYDESSRVAWIGSYQQGISQFQDGQMVSFFDGLNSGIKGRFKENGIEKDIRVHDMKLDSKRNLWFTTEFGSVPLQMRSEKGEWYAFNFQSNGERISWLEIDDSDYKWACIQGTGIMVYDDRGTPESPATHRQRLLTTSIGQGALPSAQINCITKDRNGRLWIGTSTGVAVFNNPRGVFSTGNIDAQRPVFNRRPLFTNEAVTSIAVDGQNRKWMGTRNGAYLMSEDGTEQLLEFNTENSPLFSNSIISIAIDQHSGEIFFSTDQGLISYMGDATEPEETCRAPEVFPNPFHPGIHEQMAIRGLAEFTNVRITTESGLLVQEISGSGGQAVWNGKDIRGNDIMPGVYLIMAADRENQNACIAKLAVLPKP